MLRKGTQLRVFDVGTELVSKVCECWVLRQAQGRLCQAPPAYSTDYSIVWNVGRTKSLREAL